jgi:hypothetical protein
MRGPAFALDPLVREAILYREIEVFDVVANGIIVIAVIDAIG